MPESNDLPIAPVAKKVEHFVKFGLVDGENRGKNPMNPPLEKYDPYYWMRDDTRKDEEIINHLKLENEYTRKVTDSLESSREEIYEELLSHIQETDTSAAVPFGKYEYYSHTIEGLSYSIHCRRNKELENSVEEVILDENELAKKLGTTQMNVGGLRISPSQKLLAYSVDTTGYETYEISIIDLSNHELMYKIPDVAGFEWGSDDETIYYTKMDAAHRPYQVWKNKSNKSNKLIYEEKDELFWVGLSKTFDRELLLIGSGSKETSEISFIDLRSNIDDLTMVKKRTQGVLYSISKRNDLFYIVTNIENAKNFQVLVSKIDEPDNWKPFVDMSGKIIFCNDENRSINHTTAFHNFLMIFGRENGLRQAWCVNFDEDNVLDYHKLEFPESAYVVGLGSNMEYNSDTVRITYSSMITPHTIFDYVVSNKEFKLVKQKNVPNFNQLEYETKRVYAPSKDGTMIPISVVYRKDFHLDGIKNSKLMLYGYGSYGSCIEPRFNSGILPMLDRGIVYCIAHIRGGSEMGRSWYEDQGKYLTKKNTFVDFCSCAEFLIEQGWTIPENIAIEGRSAGGLLIGAVLNMRPDLFNVAIAGVPFVDVMTTMCDPSIPLTVVEWEEWGNPNEEKFYDYINSYSPIDNVVEQRYPNILITTGLHDPRVAYWEGMKWCATLREKADSDSGLILLKTDIEAGHFSASDRYKYLREKAFEFAFLFDCLNL
ncbi:MAG: S9 family peptidase [Candidatus Thermoplasmatota archaeon]|nr:S9 family peptidase [Candidatus Thermoplasmatota archaeon]